MSDVLPNLDSLTPVELLQVHASAIEELRQRGIVRTSNNPLGDYTEWLVAKSMNLTLEANSKAVHDAVSEAGVRFQIKGRRVTASNQSRQLSAIRNYEAHDFDWLVAVIFGGRYEVLNAYLVPHEVLGKYGRHRDHVNALIVLMSGAIAEDPMVVEISEQIAA